ncbi:Riboflavin biosynthesis protein RibF [Candidatus Glomeribacter gigasporarum BEG34]|uniref:Riboflavin biosynthesis protein n=1 Tax=Candidatus Glomeribacter gigasporarum BEG34 TaxID=1070319 RepID=G2J9Y4_9BURK|nr:bifunctional riboflavin kinase/FAD synthetase [Candidatus Glomeribacter gigasporarum]CCD29581.1 Riboflavin biosynthesis protein RibF [Candidatus Glomeribacter gigasporarum BEG34]
MKIFRSLPDASHRRPCALITGNFDGVHRGHQALLARAREYAAAHGLPVYALIFEPHPREFFNPEAAPPRIQLLRDKLEALRAHGVTHAVVEHFNARFAAQSARAFVERILVDGLRARWMLAGDDFRFGRGRGGDFSLLQQEGARFGFEVAQQTTVTDARGARISSSAIRTALIAGDLEAARTLSGRAYGISGHVIHGEKRGRLLGFPTLNLRIAPSRFALAGICVARVHGLAREPLPAVASLGVRPTVDDSGRILLEAHVLDWDGDAYGARVRIEFLKKLRDEEKYTGLDALRAAIAEDVEQARAFFKLTS